MPKTLKTLPVSTPDPKGVFGQGAKALRVGLYARVSTHDQKTLPLQLSAMRDYAEKKSRSVAVEVQDVGSGATTRPQPREAHRGGPTAGDRLRPGLATGSLGAGAWWTWYTYAIAERFVSALCQLKTEYRL